MSRYLFPGAALTGLAAIIWMGWRFSQSSLLGLLIICVIAGVFVIGITELSLFRRATRALSVQLGRVAATPPAEAGALQQWLAPLPEALRAPVAQRIEGVRTPLPMPVLTPYLVSLLVMLGLLGTFAGMVDTLQGAVSALQVSTQLEAIREGLTTPISGLSLAFGTSVAGIAASAMLGLMSVLSRRDRLLQSRRIDELTRTRLAHLTEPRQQQTLAALGQLAQSLPALVAGLNQLGDRLTASQEQMQQQMVARQSELLQSTATHFQTLSDSVSTTLQHSLRESASGAAEAVRPILENTLGTLAARLQDTTDRVLGQFEEGVQRNLRDTLSGITEDNRQQRQALEAHQEDMLAQRTQLEASLRQAWLEDLSQYSTPLLEKMEQLQSQSAGAMTHWQQCQEQWLENTRELDRERSSAAKDLQKLAQALESLPGETREALANGNQQLAEAGARLNAGSADLASLSEAFESAVERWQETNSRLGEQLSGIEMALQDSQSRSDEQMQYYIRQARELIDLSLAAQKEIFGEVRRLGQREVAEIN